MMIKGQLDLIKKFIKNLAGYSSGIPLISWEIWRHSLRTDPDEELLLKEDELEIDFSLDKCCFLKNFNLYHF